MEIIPTSTVRWEDAPSFVTKAIWSLPYNFMPYTVEVFDDYAKVYDLDGNVVIIEKTVKGSFDT